MLTLSPRTEDIVVGFCVDFPAENRTEQDRQILLETFSIKIEENISRLPPRATEIPDPKDIPDVPEVAEAKRRMVDKYLENIEFVEPVLKFGQHEFRYLRHAEWRMNCHEEDLPYLSIFVQSDVENGKVEEPRKGQELGKEQEQGKEHGKELVIFCQASSPLPRLLERLQQEIPPPVDSAPVSPAPNPEASTLPAYTATTTTQGSTTTTITSKGEYVDGGVEVDQRRFLVEAVSSVQGLLSHPGLEEPQVVMLVEDLSTFEEHFLRMGRKEVGILGLESTCHMLTMDFIQFNIP